MKIPGFIFVISFSLFLAACEEPMEEPTAQPLLKGYHITAMAFDGQGNAWFGTLNQGLIKFDGQSVMVYPEITGMVRAIKVDSKNQVYMAADGLVKFDGQDFIRYDDNPLMEGNVTALDIDSKDRVWFAVGGFNHGGLGRLDGDSLSFYTPDNSPLPAHWVSAVKVGSNDEVWLSSQSSVGNLHLAKIREEDWTLFDSESLGFSPYSISNLDENSRGELIGGIDYSLSSTIALSRPPLFTFDESEGRQIMSDRPLSVIQIFVDRSDRVWCAGSGGYALYQNNTWTYDEETFKEISVFAIAQAPDGTIWLGTGDGVYLLML
ncbi:two-component regulator propeller domain-containing protein [Lunatibacter salilacus]|uniref:two-component regulator propeller domain-containing protein n=1 Tax=Lunatibacter salilacus TaxID=2483804 RepID=UPI00131E781F|nr:two-component regulator propeller domain-containing protein [Lunatibacter salilacus]